MPSTRVGRTTISFVDLIARFLVYLAEAAEAAAQTPITEVVVGRPVVFHANPEKNAFAESQLTEAIERSGLPRPTMQLEPVAAALRYEQSLKEDRIVLVGDFGGGTADFAVLRMGPGQQDAGLERVLGTSGVAQAGNVLDGHFLDAFVLGFLGRGLPWTPRGSVEPVSWNPGVHRHLRQLYDVHRLRDPELQTYLDDVEMRATDTVPVERLRKLIFDDLGYPMADAIEQAKRQMSAQPVAHFVFDAFYSERLNFETEASVPDFAQASEPVLEAYRSAVDQVLEGAGMHTTDVDEVFLTGGTSQLPFIQALFADRFGEHRIRGGEAFTTVCEGLAVT